MTHVKQLLVAPFILALLISCGADQNNTTKPKKPETPEALQDNTLEIKSYSRSSNLTDELYQELVDKTPALKKLEEDLEALSLKPSELNQQFQKYDSKSYTYYNDAKYTAAAIKDSVLKGRMLDLIATSNKRYANKTSELNSLLEQISKNTSTLNDQHVVLKMVLSLQVIEKYQDDNKPDKKEFKDLIKQQENLILQTKNLTPKY